LLQLRPETLRAQLDEPTIDTFPKQVFDHVVREYLIVGMVDPTDIEGGHAFTPAKRVERKSQRELDQKPRAGESPIATSKN
jgi:hypothetical protein